MKKTKVATALAVGAVGVLALGACSSGAQEQAVPTRDAAQRPAAVSLTGELSEVKLQHAPGVTCTKYNVQNPKQQTYQCNNLPQDAGYDAVVVSLPSAGYTVGVVGEDKDGNNPTSVLRDSEGNQIAENKIQRRATWNASTVPDADQGWSVGVGAGNAKTNSAFITVIKD